MIRSLTLVLVLLSFRPCYAQPAAGGALQDSLQTIAKDARGIVGVSFLYKGTHRRLSLHGAEHFPMQSVFKFPLALKILHDVDNGKLSIDQRIHIAKEDWVPKIWSPLKDSLKGQAVDLPLRTLLQYTVSNSDNSGCDILFNLAGGTKAVNDFIHSMGVKDIAIVATERQMAQAWDIQYDNWCTPVAMTALLEKFMDGKILKPATQAILMQFMVNTTTGPARLKGMLPRGTKLAHKTGTSNTNDKGITAATNDIGIITLPDGKSLIISVFVKDAAADEPTREKVIARIAAAAIYK